MLLSLGLPKLFWDEVTKIDVYLFNRIPASALNFNVPESLWSQKPVNYSYLQIFSYALYAHQNIGKLKLRSLNYVY